MKNRSAVLAIAFFVCEFSFAQDLTSGLLERSQIPEKYKWDTRDLYENEQAWQKDYTWIEYNISQYDAYRGRLGDSGKILLECLQFDEKVKRKLDNVWLYAKLHRDVDMQNEKVQEMWSKYHMLNTKVEIARSFIRQEIISLPEASINIFIKETSELHVYAYYFVILKMGEKHTLSQEKEDILAGVSPIIGNPYAVFGSLVYAELPFPVIKNDEGEDIQLNRSTSWRARSSNDELYRKTGYQEYYYSLSKYQGTLTKNLSGFIEGKVFMARTRNYSNSLEASLARYNIPEEVYHNLIESVGRNLQPCHRWMQMKKDLLGLDTLHIYDTRASVFSGIKRTYTWEEAEELTMESLAVLGDDYLGDIQQAYTNRWIDAFPNVGKETGGYSSGPAGPHPYVKMNWGGELFDFYTLVHELGHFMHAIKNMESQPYIYWDYPSFLSEVASTTAENISQSYLIHHSSTNEEKLYHIEQYLDNVILNIYISCMMAEFELRLYGKVENGEPLSAYKLNELYGQLLARYYGQGVSVEDADTYAWMEYPHYYLDYYLYSYATSFTAAIQIATNIRSEGDRATEKFLKFLEAGNSDYPVEMLKKAGVDMTSSQPYEAVARMMNELMDEMELLLAER